MVECVVNGQYSEIRQRIKEIKEQLTAGINLN